MASQIEDFLRRAAARHQAKIRRGHVARDTEATSAAARPRGGTNVSERSAGTVADAQDVARKSAEGSSSRSAVTGDSHEVDSGERAERSATRELVDRLRSPGGVKQAFLLSEILRRPADRW